MVAAGIAAVYRKCIAFNAWRPVLKERQYNDHYDELEANNNDLQQHLARSESKVNNLEQQLRLIQALAPNNRPDAAAPHPPASSTPSTSREPTQQYHHQQAVSPIDVPKTDHSVSRVWERDQALLQEYLERAGSQQRNPGPAPAY